MRQKLLLGNWKMNHTLAEAKAFCHDVKEIEHIAKEKNLLLGVAPSYLSLETVKNGAPYLICASQNCHFEKSGAYTGEISLPMLQELGVTWSLVGHSERRLYNDETSLTCNKKIVSLLENKMTPVYCVGESLMDFEKNLTKPVVREQLEIGLMGINAASAKNIVIAYEPIWSIGTGKNASKEIAEEVCAYIRAQLKVAFGTVADEMKILYGGSVKPNNIHEYLSQVDIDGALVGGASLKAESFIELAQNV